LLLEAGDSNSGAARHSGADRFDTAFSDGSPLNWHYRTVPQTYLAGQEIDYSRGRGLGGSTAINFCAWTVGPKDDYDEWARIVGDERFVWSNVKRVLKRISNLNHQIPDQKLRHVVYPKPHHHSTEGNVKLTYGDEWLPDVGDIFTAARQAGHRINSDVNDGDAIGMGMGSVCIAKGIRATSASAYLSQPPQNLVIVVNAQIARVLFIKRQAIGVERIDGQQFIARNQVILSAGALNTPQILKCSGIGPANELEKYGIPLIYELPAVGENLQDHCFSTMGIVLEKDTTLPIGPLKQTPTPMGWLKLPSITSSPEFQSLSPQTQEHILRPTVPVIEIAAVSARINRYLTASNHTASPHHRLSRPTNPQNQSRTLAPFV
jgi:choline dehydrogenase-like flavoprotein